MVLARRDAWSQHPGVQRGTHPATQKGSGEPPPGPKRGSGAAPLSFFSQTPRSPPRSVQNTESLIGVRFSNMFLMKTQHITLGLLAGRAQFTKVGVQDKKRVHLQSRLCNESHSARVEQNIIESNISEHFHHN